MNDQGGTWIPIVVRGRTDPPRCERKWRMAPKVLANARGSNPPVAAMAALERKLCHRAARENGRGATAADDPIREVAQHVQFLVVSL